MGADPLAPYLASSVADEEGEFDLYCPLHDDTRRSARLNKNKGVWYCHGCGEGGPIRALLSRQAEWLPPRNGSVYNGKASRGEDGKADLSEKDVAAWARNLAGDASLSGVLHSLKHLTSETISRFEIGWEPGRQAYSIPIRDEEGALVNVRFYQPFPTSGRARKMSNLAGHGSPARLYPIGIFSETEGPIVICEGEWDTLATIQNGFPAITRTSGASTWKGEWNRFFAGRTVYLAQDCDTEGQKGNAKIGRSLSGTAGEIYVPKLPFPILEKGGQDIGDFWGLGTAHDFHALLADAAPFDPSSFEDEARFGTIIDASDASNVGSPLRIPLTVKGKLNLGHTIVRDYTFSCSQDAGQLCESCPLQGVGGIASGRIEAEDPLVLSLFDVTTKQVKDLIRTREGVPKNCPKVNFSTDSWQSVETLFARPSIEGQDGSSGDLYRTLKITSVGKHDTPPNATVQVLGALYPNPRTQGNEFLAWDVSRMRSELDHFEINSASVEKLRRFAPTPGQSPLKKAVEIARALSRNVTRIYGRDELHVAMDLVYHSVLSFSFNGKHLPHGWLELLVVGDTRTGKSEVASRLAQHYSAGEIISCESATFAGVVAAVQQFGGKEWVVTWGAIPINDRRLVVLDEVSGLTQQEIAQLSYVRSAGIVQIQKVAQETANARTRLIWLGNPREARMTNFTYGVQAVKQLIGNNEDIARFDFAMSLRSDEVSLELINGTPEDKTMPYRAEDCSLLVRWAWSRKAEDVVFDKAATAHVLSESNRLGRIYVDDPPLIQGADVRVKIARLSVALAARTFSTDETFSRVLVGKRHVADAVRFLEHIYDMDGFGYGEISRMRASEAREGRENEENVRDYLKGRGQLAAFLTSNSSFRRFDLEEVLNVSKEEANAMISTLWEKRMVRKEKGSIVVQPVLHGILRSAR